jgi:putative transcriptional regulator
MSKLNIDKLLKQYGLTQKDLSECTGINKNTISKYCNDTFENINKTHIDLLCKFFNCTPNDLFEVDNTVEVKTPNMILYDEESDEFEMYNKALKEYKQILTKQNVSKSNCKYINNYDNFDLIDENLKINEDTNNYSAYNIDIPNIKEQMKFINCFLEKQVEKEVEKQFNEKYNDFLSEYIKNYISEYLLSKFSNQKSSNQNVNKNFYKDIYKKYKNSKINMPNDTTTSSKTNNTSSNTNAWGDILDNYTENNDISIDNEFEPYITIKKKEYNKKD